MTRTSSRHPANKTIALFLLGFGLLILGGIIPIIMSNKSEGQGGQPSLLAPAKVNYVAPDLNLTNLKGQKVSLDDYRGQVTLVNNWATWCPPCQAEMPDLEAYYQAYRQQGFTVVAIEAGETQDEVAEFVRRFDLSFPVWLDPQMESLAAFRYNGLPSSYVIDRNGMVRLAWAGAISYDMMEKYITPLLKE